MSAAADQALRAWVNGRTDLMDGSGGGVLSRGCFLKQLASPGDGAYTVVSSGPSVRSAIAAEDDRVSTARVTFMVYAGTQEAAENACVALANAIRSLRGAPVPAGASGTTLLVHDNLTEPADVPMPGEGGEQFAYVTSADIVMYTPGP